MPEFATFTSDEAKRRFDLTRRALSQCTFLPGSAHKRFARQVAQQPLETVSEKQRQHVIRLAWRYRRQMPLELIPTKGEIEGLDAPQTSTLEQVP
jgi:hypothetical protein